MSFPPVPRHYPTRPRAPHPAPTPPAPRTNPPAPPPKAEMATFETAGRLPRAQYRHSTLYTTLTPCDMCTGACLWFGVGRVVMGEARSVATGGDALLRRRGVQVVDMDDETCFEMLQRFMREFPEKWRFD